MLSPQDQMRAFELALQIEGLTRDLQTILAKGKDPPDPDDLGPKNPANKIGRNLSPRGVEVAYRMFDAGLTRYAVKEALGISFGAATHRLDAWMKAGGKDREKQPLD